MKDRTEELAKRRQALTLRSERLRRDLAEDAEVIGETVTRVDDAVESARRFASPAMLLAGGALLILLIANPARSLLWLTRATVALSVARRAVSLFRQARAELSPPRG